MVFTFEGTARFDNEDYVDRYVYSGQSTGGSPAVAIVGIVLGSVIPLMVFSCTLYRWRRKMYLRFRDFTMARDIPRLRTESSSYVQQFAEPPPPSPAPLPPSSPPPLQPPPATMHASYAQPAYDGDGEGNGNGPRSKETRRYRARAYELADSLPVFEAGPQQAPLPCPICLDPLQDKKVTCPGCLHLFHAPCLRAWLVKDVAFNCPVCRMSITSSKRHVQPV